VATARVVEQAVTADARVLRQRISAIASATSAAARPAMSGDASLLDEATMA
jgi:hypothetical protein